MLEILAESMNVASGLLLSVPAVRMTRDTLTIEKARKESVKQKSNGSRFSDATLELMRLNAAELEKKASRWDYHDTLFLYAGLGLFIVASIIKLALMLFYSGTI